MSSDNELPSENKIRTDFEKVCQQDRQIPFDINNKASVHAAAVAGNEHAEIFDIVERLEGEKTNEEFCRILSEFDELEKSSNLYISLTAKFYHGEVLMQVTSTMDGIGLSQNLSQSQGLRIFEGIYNNKEYNSDMELPDMKSCFNRVRYYLAYEKANGFNGPVDKEAAYELIKKNIDSGDSRAETIKLYKSLKPHSSAAKKHRSHILLCLLRIMEMIVIVLGTRYFMQYQGYSDTADNEMLAFHYVFLGYLAAAFTVFIWIKLFTSAKETDIVPRFFLWAILSTAVISMYALAEWLPDTYIKNHYDQYVHIACIAGAVFMIYLFIMAVRHLIGIIVGK